MCGIVGIIDQKNTSNKKTLEVMTDTLRSRGPDDSGYTFINKQNFQIGLGQRRLSILDLSNNGHQPMNYEHLGIVYNGEVYNFKDIRAELIKYGYSFESNSDTEVILKAFHKWGVDSIDRFRGMFAFIIYDQRDEKIYVFRDRVGVKPLFYYYKDGLFLIASELKAFYPHSRFEKIINKNSLSLYLQLGYIQAPFSIFENVSKLKPAHYIEYSLEDQTYEEKKYWNVEKYYTTEKLDISYEEAKDELENLLVDAFSLRMISDVPVGTFLSGGIDSSLVTAILQKTSSKQINTFTIGFDEQQYNEAPFAKAIANNLNTKHTEHYCSTKDILNIIPNLPIIYDEPFGDSSAIPTSLVSVIAKENVSVVLSGDGGDELFCGYSSYELFYNRFRSLQKLPLKGFFKNIPLSINHLPFIGEKYYTKVSKLINVLEYQDISNMFKISNSVYTKKEINSLFIQDSYFFKEDQFIDSLDDFENMMLSDFNGYLADDILVKVDRASMGISLESREPLLDNKIIEFSAQLPMKYKINKRILKDILAQYIPRELFERKKTGFGIPINTWLRGELKDLVEYYLSEDLLKEIGLFNISYINTLKRLFYKGYNDDRKIWTLLMFVMWYKENIKGMK